MGSSVLLRPAGGDDHPVLTLVPFFYNSKVYTAYEFLEKRFDAKTRSLTSFLFLLSRGMAVGAAVSAPAVVLSLVLGWNLTATSLAITLPAVVYTMFGGVQAVTWTDVKIMVLVVFGLFRSSYGRARVSRWGQSDEGWAWARPTAGNGRAVVRSQNHTPSESGKSRRCSFLFDFGTRQSRSSESTRALGDGHESRCMSATGRSRSRSS